MPNLVIRLRVGSGIKFCGLDGPMPFFRAQASQKSSKFTLLLMISVRCISEGFPQTTHFRLCLCLEDGGIFICLGCGGVSFWALGILIPFFRAQAMQKSSLCTLVPMI